MKNFSAGVRFAWQIASWEAGSLKLNQIDPEHILLGLLSLIKTKQIDSYHQLTPVEKHFLDSEMAAIDQILSEFGTTTTAIRRSLRKTMPMGRFKGNLQIVHRSEATKQVFEIAEELARKSRYLTSLHLLAALIRSPQNGIGSVLTENKIPPAQLWTAISNFKPVNDTGQHDGDISRHDLESIYSYSQTTNNSSLTIVFDDIVGSMALFNRMGDEEFYELIKYHDHKIRKILSRKRKGEIIKSTGDGLLMIFSDPVAAVDCAIDIQRAFIHEELLKIRIGMDMGEVKQVLEERSRDIFGIKVSAASRITEAAEGGHILTSKSVYQAVEKHIKSTFIEWKYLGSRNFKPGEPTIDIYEVMDSRLPLEPMDSLDSGKVFVGPPVASVSLLDEYGRDLTQDAREGKLGPFAGRRNETLQIIQTLAQKYCNNPLLVGRAGVGKTSLVQALALRLLDAKDSEILSNRRIVALNMNKIMGGLSQKIEFEERLGNVIEEAISQPEIILFIDEIHNFIGMGQPESMMNVAHLINPMITHGELRIIGTTTEEEYTKFIMPDTSMERQFQKIVINEPSKKETMEMLNIFRQKLEEYHKVWITDRALESAIDLSIEFDPDHALPAKAIDLVDEAGAQIHIPDLSMLGGKKADHLGVQRGGTHTILNVLAIVKVLAQKTRIPTAQIMKSLDEKDITV